MTLKLKKTALVSALMLELTTAVQAASIQVDGTTCTLPDAITAANTDTATGGCVAGVGDDILELDINGSPFNLTTKLPNVVSNITFNGNGSTISRDKSSVEDFNILEIGGSASTEVELNDLTITGGSNNGNFGGGVKANGVASVRVNNCIFTGNSGGALRLSNVTLSEINHTIVSENTGNDGNFYNGAVAIISGAANITNSTISNNTNAAVMVGGGGLYVVDLNGPTTVNIVNSTISNNSATQSGGGIALLSYDNGLVVNLTHTTVTGNSSSMGGGGIFQDGGTLTVQYSLISNNTANTSGSQLETASVYASVYTNLDAINVLGEQSISGVLGATLGQSDIIPTEPAEQIINPVLANNGGPTPTHALVVGSPAVDAIATGLCAEMTDQTGNDRPIDGNFDGVADCDVGAFELPNPDIIFINGFN